MSYLDAGGPWPDPPREREGRRARHRARQAEAAPDPYPTDLAIQRARHAGPEPDEDGGYRYGDGRSAVPLYREDPYSADTGGYPEVTGGLGGASAPPAPDYGWSPERYRTDPGPGPGYPPPPYDAPSDDDPPTDRTWLGEGTPAPAVSSPPEPGYRPAFADEPTGPLRPLAGRPAFGAGPAGGPGPDPDETAALPLEFGNGRARREPPGAEPGQPVVAGSGRPDGAAAGPPRKRGRAGRNLPAAIGVGLTLGALVLASLFLWHPAFVFLAAAAASVAVWETVRAVSTADGPRAPLPPLLAGTLIMITLAWFGGVEALTLGLVLTVLATMVWRLGDGPVGYQRDVLSATLVAVYVPFLAGFAVLTVRPADGALRVVVMLAAVVLSDTCGYAAGVFFGRHGMAPTVSPKKSWEGFAGSLVGTAVGGALLLLFLFGRPWWQGAIFGLVISAVAVLGDLAESLLKRDLGVKDMSNLLPGHGGLMDRLDSVLFAAPSAFVLLSLLVPVS